MYVGVPLIKPMMLLRDLKSAIARHKVKRMAQSFASFVTPQVCSSEHARRGLQACSYSALIFFTRYLTCLQNVALITNKPVSQKYHRLIQRYPDYKESLHSIYNLHLNNARYSPCLKIMHTNSALTRK